MTDDIEAIKQLKARYFRMMDTKDWDGLAAVFTGDVEIDVTGEGDALPWEYADWASTRAGAWMAGNAWRYGFVMSYPRGAFDVTCYDYEPWHYRYVGRALAAEITASGLTPRQLLWGLQ